MNAHAFDHPFDRFTETELRRRQSAKWRVYPEDVLPAWVAEMDYPIADPIKAVLRAAIDAEDVGYADPRGLGDAFAPWADRLWRWSVRPTDVRVAPDVVTALAELLLVATKRGDGIVIDPPVYPPFAGTVHHLERTLLEAPLLRDDAGRYRLDFAAIEKHYANGARAHVLCSPQNPTGVVYAAEDLARLAHLAARHDVLVVSDEIHAPMTYDGAVHHPFPTVSAEAARTSIVLTSASKTWNLAGLKAAVLVACDDRTRTILDRLPIELPYHAGHLGVLAARAAFEHGDAWLATTRAILDRNRALLATLLAEKLPAVRYVPPSASYLAWLDFRALGLGADPAKAILKTGKLALSSGPTFGTGGDGFARLNLATTGPLLVEAITRIAASIPAGAR